MGLDDLPPELIDHIFSFLAFKDYQQTILVDKKMHYFSCLGFEKNIKKELEIVVSRIQKAEELEKQCPPYIKKYPPLGLGEKRANKLIDIANAVRKDIDSLLVRLRRTKEIFQEREKIIKKTKNRFICSQEPHQTQTDSADSPPPQTSSPRCKP